MSDNIYPPPRKVVTGEKLRGAEKLTRIPIKVNPTKRENLLKKPSWIRASFAGTKEVMRLKGILRENKLHTVCEEAACPNLGECFGNGTATFLIMGDICTRRCPFCDVAHGRPKPLDVNEPKNLANTINAMGLRYVVITSVDRDDLRDGGGAHFKACIESIRAKNKSIHIEILTPDFRGRAEVALQHIFQSPPDVFNHNLETIPRLYTKVRPGSDYQYSLDLLALVKKNLHDTPTKSGIMLGLGETFDEVVQVMKDLRNHQVDMITLGQYLQPSLHHLAVEKYWSLEEFAQLKLIGDEMGFTNTASGPMVRSSYHAENQAKDPLQVAKK